MSQMNNIKASVNQKHKIKTRMVFVTPKMAAKMLGSNSRNRRLYEPYAQRLADDMAADRWLVTHQGISFNCDGTLLDGQHRLRAIVISGKGQWMNVTTGLPRKAIGGMDYPKPRSAKDLLVLTTGNKEPNLTRQVAGTCAMVNGNRSRFHSLTRQAQMEAYAKHRSAITWAADVYQTTKKGLGRAPVLGVIARSYYTADRKAVARFCEVLKTGVVRSQKEEGIIRLRDWLSRAPSAGSEFQAEAYRKTEYALKAYLTNKPFDKLLESSTEQFPIPGEKPEDMGTSESK